MSDKLHGSIKTNATGVRLGIKMDKSLDGLGQTGLVASGITASYWREGGSVTPITVADLGTIGTAYSSGGWKEADATRNPGAYRLDPPDAAWAAGAEWVEIIVLAPNCFPHRERFPLESAGSSEVMAGQTALPAAIWNTLTSSMNTVGSIGLKLKNWVLGSDNKALLSTDTQTGVTIPTVTTLTNAPTVPSVQAIRTEMDANSTKLANLDATISSRSTFAGGAVTSVTNPVTVGTNQDKTGYSLLSGVIDSIRSGLSTHSPLDVWNVSTNASFIANTLGAKLKAWVLGSDNRALISRDENVFTSTERGAVATAVRTELGTELGRLDASVGSRLATTAYTAPPTPPSAVSIANAVVAKDEIRIPYRELAGGQNIEGAYLVTRIGGVAVMRRTLTVDSSLKPVLGELEVLV